MINTTTSFLSLGVASILTLFYHDSLAISQPTPVAKPIVSLCVGNGHACAVFNSKKMKCWGWKYAWGLSISSTDYLGDTSTELGDFIPYIDVGTNTGIEKVSCGSQHVCMKLDTGHIKCLGNNEYGRIGIGNSSNPIGAWNGFIGDELPIVNLGNGLKLFDITLGSLHSCVLLTGNKIKCFGNNYLGQLGYGDQADRGASISDMGENLAFVDLGVGVEISSIHSGPGALHNCVILSAPASVAQKIKCWGFGTLGQLGYGNPWLIGDNPGEMGDALPIVDLGTESRVKQLALEWSNTCALLVDDTLKCVGGRSYGQLGSGITVKLIAAGSEHTCIVYNDLVTLKCIGYNSYGQLGQGDNYSRVSSLDAIIPNMTAVDLGTEALQIKSVCGGASFTCVVFVDSSLKCFGDNRKGQLAVGSTANAGDGKDEMGTNLAFSVLFSPTNAPSRAPSIAPTKSPIPPTKLPTSLPTSTPTKLCDYQSAKLCRYDYTCMWKSVGGVKQCVVFDCFGLNKGNCGKERKKCKWSKKDTTCYPKRT